MDAPRIRITDAEDGLADELRERLYEYNAETIGVDDGRLTAAAIRDDEGRLVAGMTGWTWAGVAATSTNSGCAPTTGGRDSEPVCSRPPSPKREHAAAS